VRRPLLTLGAALGGLLLVRLTRGRRPPPATLDPGPDPRALELRRKLAESRTLVEERDEFESGETPVDRVEDVADKRRLVHERGRATAQRMKETPPDK
jgi:hypothetical protein